MSRAEPRRRVRRRPRRVPPPGRFGSSLICQRLETERSNALCRRGEYPGGSVPPGEHSIQYRLPRSRICSWGTPSQEKRRAANNIAVKHHRLRFGVLPFKWVFLRTESAKSQGRDEL